MDVGAASNAPPSRRCCYALLERHTASRRATHRRSGTSDPIAVRPRETLDVVASVEIEGLSSAAGARLAYLGAAGQVLDTVKVLTNAADDERLPDAREGRHDPDRRCRGSRRVT